MSLQDEYHTLWNWLLDRGTVVALLIINVFLYVLVAVVLLCLKLFSGRH